MPSTQLSETRNLIDSLLEVRSRNPLDSKELVNRLRNAWIKTNGNPPSEGHERTDKNELHLSDSGKYISLKLNKDNEFPGIIKKGKSVDTSEFERLFLRGTGWHVSAFKKGRFRSFNGHMIAIEKQSETEDKPEFLYHVTHSDNESRIMSKGIKPFSRPDIGTFTYREPRIFLFREFHLPSFRFFIKVRTSMSLGVYRKSIGPPSWVDPSFTIFRIDTSIFNRFNIFKDRDSGEVYTKTHIPPDALEIVHRHKGTDLKTSPFIKK